MLLAHAFGKTLGLFEIRLRRLAPDQVRVRRIGDRPGDAGVETVLDLIEAFRGPSGIIIDEWAVALVNIRGQKLCGFRIRAGDDQGRRSHDVGSKPRGIQVADMGSGRDQNLAAEMAALLFRCQLVLIMHTRSTGLDESLHDLEGIERAAEAGFRVRNDRCEPCIDRQALAFRGFDLVGALQRLVYAFRKLRRSVCRVQ
eukprot:gene27062-biopygen23214